MRRGALALALSLLVPGIVHATPAAPGGGPRLALTLLATSAPGELVTVWAAGAARTTAEAELLSLADGLAAGLLAAQIGERVQVAGWPVAPGERADVVLTRRDVYAPGARIWAVDPEGLREVPRSPLVLFAGEGLEDPGTRVVAVADPRTGAVRGSAVSLAGVYELRPAPSVLGGPGRLLVAPLHTVVGADGELRVEETSWGCAVHHFEAPPLQRLAPSMRRRSGEALSTLHTITVAVDTDNELFTEKFGTTPADEQDAIDYIAELFAEMNVIYERDLNVRLLQGETYLRRIGADPYSVTGSPADTPHLHEVEAVWQNPPYNTVQRGLVMMLSGKSDDPHTSWGVATVGALCDTAAGFSYTQVFKFAENTAVFDNLVVPHEIGHNFGADHTHCTKINATDFIDQCVSGGGLGCYVGATSCPAATMINGVLATGTLMSYCHTLDGCDSFKVFHPGSVAALSPHLDGAVGTCVSPVFHVAAITPKSGPTSGGTHVTITGADFDPSATVSFGGTVASDVTWVNSSTMTAVSPPYVPSETVTVMVENPGPVMAGVPFFYAPEPTATDYYTVTPCRVFDTRNTVAPLAAGEARTFQVAGVCSIPSTAISVSANLTVVGPAAAGFVSVYPGNAFFLGTSAVNFKPGQTRANNAVIALASDGNGDIGILNGAAGNVHVVLDVTGYFEEP